VCGEGGKVFGKSCSITASVQNAFFKTYSLQALLVQLISGGNQK
jgi:hypothetical protein